MEKITSFLKVNKKLVLGAGSVIAVCVLVAGVSLVQTSSAYKVELANLRAHGLNNYHEDNTFVKKQTITDMQDLLNSEIKKAEDFLAKLEETNLNEKYKVEVAETTPVTIKAEEIEKSILEKQNAQRDALVANGTNIYNSKTAYNSTEQAKLDGFKTSYTDLAYNEDIFTNEETLTKCQQLEKDMKQVEADAKKRIDAEKKKKEEANKPNQQAPSTPGYVDPGTGYTPPASGGNNNSSGGSTSNPAPTPPPVTYSCPYLSVGAAEAAGQAATGGSYHVQDCGDGSYNYQATWDTPDWGSSDF